MDILATIKNRRSVRKFRDKEISEDLINKLKQSLIWAPSAGNLQSRKFYFVFDQEIREKLMEAAFGQAAIEQAPLVVVACTDERIFQRYGQRGKDLYTICDTAMSVQNMMLLAYEQGLGSVVIASFDDTRVAHIVKIPDHFRPIMIVPVGYPAEGPSVPPRVSQEEAVQEIK